MSERLLLYASMSQTLLLYVSVSKALFLYIRESNASNPNPSPNPRSQTLNSNLESIIKRRENFFSMIFLLFCFFSHSRVHRFILIYSRQGIQCFKFSFTHVWESNASNPNPNPQSKPLTLTPIYRSHIHLHLTHPHNTFFQLCKHKPSVTFLSLFFLYYITCLPHLSNGQCTTMVK